MPKRGRLSFGFIDDEEIVKSVIHHCLGFILHSICGIKRLMTQIQPKVRPNANGNEHIFFLLLHHLVIMTGLQLCGRE